jgi:hypothetical protein
MSGTSDVHRIPEATHTRPTYRTTTRPFASSSSAAVTVGVVGGVIRPPATAAVFVWVSSNTPHDRLRAGDRLDGWNCLSSTPRGHIRQLPSGNCFSLSNEVVELDGQRIRLYLGDVARRVSRRWEPRPRCS